MLPFYRHPIQYYRIVLHSEKDYRDGLVVRICLSRADAECWLVKIRALVSGLALVDVYPYPRSPYSHNQ